MAKSIRLTNVTIPITYSELVSLRDSGGLYPGATYRITDYECSSSDTDTAVESNKFDILVKAIDTNKLSEHCGALRNASDTHFPEETNFDAWEVWYCLDNDNTRFAWASASGKGVIYRLIDEFGNDCPYDFKSIMFKRTASWFSSHKDWCISVLGSVPTSDMLYYTFSFIVDPDSDGADLSMNYYNGRKEFKFYQNKIAPYNSEGVQELNKNVFILTSIDEDGCSNNTFGNSCSNNTFGNWCSNNTFGNSCSNNTFGNWCSNNTFGNSCYYNTFGNSCYYNTFGNGCYYNTFGNGCYYNTFGNGCSNNTFGNSCSNNTFGNSCSNNTFGMSTSSLQSYCRYNHIEDGVQYIYFYATSTTSSSVYLQNITIHRGVKGTSSSRVAISVTEVNKSYNREYGNNASGTLVNWVANA